MSNKNINEIDKQNMRQVILDSPAQFKKGLELAKDIKIDGKFKSIMISGMGGSALPGNLLRIYINNLQRGEAPDKRLAVFQNRFYSLPPEAYENSLNIISSYSGNTEETVFSFEEVLKNNLPCVGISNGGKIEEMCKENNIPHIKLPAPGENFQPRMANGYVFASIFQILVNSGLVKDKTGELVELSEKLKSETKKLEEKGKEIAKKLIGKTPVVYASTKYKALAMIWKIKFNENAKTPSFWNFFPELNHNEMVGFTNPQAKFFVLMLRDPKDHPRNIQRFETTSKLLKEKGVESEIINMEGGGVFYNIFSTLYLGDWVSYYLALEYGQNPTPVDMVEEFKDLLK
ncbi:bifunctional phosphoglucose/phosphomannose isomerase [bacterium BMS3Abin15]|nr:bifunctional phosphoglucose/phosphomannose isomerase [bacterium BMS3Abin15]